MRLPCGMLEHYLSPKDELREIYRVLKPGGMLYISTPNHKKESSWEETGLVTMLPMSIYLILRLQP